MNLKQHHVAAILRGIDHDVKASERISPAKGKILAAHLDIVKDYVVDAANVSCQPIEKEPVMVDGEELRNE